ncbi:hypothetical protein GS493_21400 [Rhodococcus hoagii]|nr:hypothetical protein [Prescottella equi]
MLGPGACRSSTRRRASVLVAALDAFYAHESCGKCTPCREAPTGSCRSRAPRTRRGHCGGPREVARRLGHDPRHSFCALGDGAASPIMSSLKYFRDE